MNAYFAVLKKGVSFNSIKSRLQEGRIKVVKYYSKLKIVKFETDRPIEELKFDFFETVERENNTFKVD